MGSRVRGQITIRLQPHILQRTLRRRSGRCRVQLLVGENFRSEVEVRQNSNALTIDPSGGL